MPDTFSLERAMEREATPAERQSLCDVVREIGAQGWCQGTGGNFSVTLSHEPLRLLITRSGREQTAPGPRGPDDRGAEGAGRSRARRASRPPRRPCTRGSCR